MKSSWRPPEPSREHKIALIAPGAQSGQKFTSGFPRDAGTPYPQPTAGAHGGPTALLPSPPSPPFSLLDPIWLQPAALGRVGGRSIGSMPCPAGSGQRRLRFYRHSRPARARRSRAQAPLPTRDEPPLPARRFNRPPWVLAGRSAHESGVGSSAELALGFEVTPGTGCPSSGVLPAPRFVPLAASARRGADFCPQQVSAGLPVRESPLPVGTGFLSAFYQLPRRISSAVWSSGAREVPAVCFLEGFSPEGSEPGLASPLPAPFSSATPWGEAPGLPSLLTALSPRWE